MFSTWNTTVLVDLLYGEKEPIEWRSLHVGAERGSNCDLRLCTSSGLPYGQLGHENAVRRGKALSGVEDPLSHGCPWTRGGGLAEMLDVQGSACFENRETEFRSSRCIREGGVDAPVLWCRLVNYVYVKLRNKGRLEEWGLPFGGKYDNEFMLRSMMWADTHWLFSDSKDKLVYMVNDIIGGLLGGFCSPSYLCLKSG